MLKTIAVLLITLSTLLLVNVGQASDGLTSSSENFRKPALATAMADLDRAPAFVGTIEQI